MDAFRTQFFDNSLRHLCHTAAADTELLGLPRTLPVHIEDLAAVRLEHKEPVQQRHPTEFHAGVADDRFA